MTGTGSDTLELGAAVAGGSIEPAVLDGLAWEVEVGPYAAHGHCFRVRSTDGELARHLATLLASFADGDGDADADGGDGVRTYSLFPYDTEHGSAWTLYVDGHRLTQRSTPRGLVAMLLWDVNRKVIASVTDRVALHAGCVARDGRGVVLAAPMESGKTTLVTGLLRRGLDYLTDEAAVVDPTTLALHAYPKALSIDRGSWELFPELEPSGAAAGYVDDQWHVPVGRIRDDNIVATATPTLLLAPTYVRGGTTRIEPVRPSQMVHLLAESTFHFHQHGHRNLEVLARLVETCSYHRLEVADLDEACDLVLDLMETT